MNGKRRNCVTLFRISEVTLTLTATLDDIIPRSGDTETDVPFSQVSPQWLNLRSKARTLGACNLIDVKGFANRFLPFFDSKSELVLSEYAS